MVHIVEDGDDAGHEREDRKVSRQTRSGPGGEGGGDGGGGQTHKELSKAVYLRVSDLGLLLDNAPIVSGCHKHFSSWREAAYLRSRRLSGQSSAAQAGLTKRDERATHEVDVRVPAADSGQRQAGELVDSRRAVDERVVTTRHRDAPTPPAPSPPPPPLGGRKRLLHGAQS